MEIILLEDVPHLGSMGELVKVKPGYGRNYLIPRQLARLATAGSKAQLEHEMRGIEERKQKQKAGALEMHASLNEMSVTIARQAGEDGRLFGSVTNRDIEAALAAQGVEVDKRRIMLREPIKTLGIYKVPVKLHADVTSELRVWVAAL